MQEFHAFIDESGNHDLDTSKQGTTKYYVVAAVICRSSESNNLSNKINLLSKKHFSGSEIKSSKLTDERRIKIIKDLIEIDFKFSAIAVNKEEVSSDGGFAHKRSFIKYIHSLLYQSIINIHADIAIYADEHGREEFMSSFRQYIKEKHITDLFHTCTVTHVRSSDTPNVQLADFLAGTIRVIYEEKASPDVIEYFLKLTKSSKLSIEEWPPKYFKFNDQKTNSTKHDVAIYNLAMNSAGNFIQKYNHHLDDETCLQVRVLKFLLFRAKFESYEYISTREILDHLSTNSFGAINEHQLKSQVIAKLRDRGVLISSSNKGYKIPQNYQDYMDFINLVNTQSIPLLERLNLARQAVHSATLGEIATLEEPQFQKLKRVIDALESNHLSE